MLEDIIRAFRVRYGEGWTEDEEANLRFSVEAEHLIGDVAGAHLIGDPEFEEGGIMLRVWVDYPIRDLMTADELAYGIFARLCDDLFYAERRFDIGGVAYPFVTGSTRHGHVGTLLLAGPHAADFADRHKTRLSGGLRFQA